MHTGGVQHAVKRIAEAIAQNGIRVTLLVGDRGGELEHSLLPGIEVRALARSGWLKVRFMAMRADLMAWLLAPRALLPGGGGSRTLACLPALIDYLRGHRPDVLFAATPYVNIEAYLARRAAGVPIRLILSERTYFSAGKPRKQARVKLLAPLMRRAYGGADRIVSVSHGVADDLVRHVGIPREQIVVLHNPTISRDFAVRAAEPVDHPWFAAGEPPIVLGVGRPASQKDFPTLIRAVARARRRRRIRLAILGQANDAAQRDARVQEMQALADELGLGEDVAFLGYDPNPARYMARSSVFALSSRFEGFPNVLLEALASGCPVVSTDCPSGPAEILACGRYGRLVPVGDDEAMAEAILATLEAPIPPERLKARAAEFGYETSIAAYCNVLYGRPQDHSYLPPDKAASSDAPRSVEKASSDEC